MKLARSHIKFIFIIVGVFIINFKKYILKNK